MENVINIKKNKNSAKKCNLQQYPSQNMDCPVTKVRVCHFIPLREVNGFAHNPMRPNGTLPGNVSNIFDSLVTEPGGQLEPICLEWKFATGQFDIVFGCNREWSTADAYLKGFTIANHPDTGEPGIWAWIFSGSSSERTKIQMRENGNKTPGAPATKDEMSSMLAQFIDQGGLDVGYPTLFSDLDDEAKYKRAKDFMNTNTPYWGGRKFRGIWNKLTQDGSPTIPLSFNTYSKNKLAEYFCANNSYGITLGDLKATLSGTVVTIEDIKYGIYFVNNKSEISGALPTNASKCMVSNKIDHMIIVGALNSSTTKNIDEHRKAFEKAAKDWNDQIFKAFNEIFWMPQTDTETKKHILSGTWVGRKTV